MKLFFLGIMILFSACKAKDIFTKKEYQSPNKVLSDIELLDLVQEQSFNYFWEGGEPISGAARERIHMDGDYAWHSKAIVTSGGTGFGIMATIVGVERKFISRKSAFRRLKSRSKPSTDTLRRRMYAVNIR